MSPRYSILDLAPVRSDGTIAEAFRNSLDLAQHAERWGYTRFWLAEHHNMPGIASAATAVLIGYIAGGTSTLRVGSGGIMLPNHSSLVIAEQFGTLETLYPGRIDLGVGRAPGTDGVTAHALRRGLNEEDFPRMLEVSDNFGFDLLQTERDLFDIDHCAAGAYIAQDWDFPDELAAAIATHHDDPVPGEASLENLVKVSWRFSDALGYAAFSPEKKWSWEELSGLLPVHRSTWLGGTAEAATAEISKRLAAAPLVLSR